MVGKLYVDGVDAYVNYGICIAEKGYNGIIGYPPLKKVDANDWMEEDGLDVDLSSPALDTRDFPIAFLSHAIARTGTFFELISDEAYHMFQFRTLGREYKLRLVSQTSLNGLYGLELFTLQFANDFPISDEYVYIRPQSNIPPISGYELDGVDLANYGVFILQGTLDEIEKSPAVKKKLITNLNRQNGAKYTGKFVVFQTKEVRLKCLMRAGSITEFWRNYDSLLHDLTKPDERTLFVDSTNSEYPCYYKNSTVTEFYPTGKIWFEFSLNLVFTSFRVSLDEILSSEMGEWIVEEGDGFAINLGEIVI